MYVRINLCFNYSFFFSERQCFLSNLRNFVKTVYNLERDFVMFYDNLKSVCDKLGLKVTPTIENAGLKKSNGTKWKQGILPNAEAVIKLANYLNVSTDYLLLGKQPTISPEYKSLVTEYDKLSNDNKQLLREIISSMINIQEANNKRSEIKLITIRHSIYKVSAGVGYDLDEGDQWEKIKIPETPESLKADFAITVDGDSMEPKFHDGDIILVKSQPAVKEGQIGVFTVEEKGYIKKCGKDRLISLNDKYEDILLSKYDPDDIRCNGLVIGRV